MSFINQKIETPDQVQRFEALHLVSPLTNAPVSPWMWTADEGRGFYLVALGGGALEVPFLFAFAVPGGVIEVESERKATGNSAAGTAQVDWNVIAVRIPRALAPRAQELMVALTEAFTVHGVSFRSLPAERVHITLPAPSFV